MNRAQTATAWLITSFLLLSGAGRVQLGAAPAPSGQSSAASSKKKAVTSTPSSSSSSKKKQATTSSAKNTRARTSAKSKAAVSRRTVGKRGGRRRASDHYTVIGQQRPAPERVMEIERALAQRGLLSAEPDGTWDDSTTDALRRFQQQSNLRADGKLSSRSLLALGLGPRRGGPPPAVNPQPPPPPSPPAAALASPSEAKDPQPK